MMGYKRDVVAYDSGRLLVAKSFVPLLERNRLTKFKTFMGHPGDAVAKKVLAERYTLRLELKVKGKEKKSFFLKRYHHLSGRPPGPLAQAEWDAMWWFHEEGISGPRPVALGIARDGAFVLSEGVQSVMKLEKWAEENLTNPSKATSLRIQSIKNQLIDEVAEIVGRMHRAGMHHQDLYLCHFLCGSRERGSPLTLIDLQRVRRPGGGLSFRWRIKDLAQLYFSSQAFVSKEDLSRFWQRYTSVYQHQRSPGILVFLMVLIKAQRIKRHTEKHGL